jgi:nitrile hydratase accessory protein
MTDPDRKIADLDGLPRKNGELVFDAPWQGRAFGMAAVLRKTHGVDWEAFRDALVERIAREPDAPYYANWLAALERVLLDRDVLTEEEIDRRQLEYRTMERQGVF